MRIIPSATLETITRDRQLLVIEDHPMVRKTIVRILRKTFREIVEAADFASAQKALQELSPLGVVVSDLELNSGLVREEGLELAKISREQRGKLQQIFILQTGTEYAETKARIATALAEGSIDAYLPKPYSSLILKAILHATVLKQRGLMTRPNSF